MSTRSDLRRSNFLAWMKRRGTNVTRVARESGIPRPSLYSYARGDVAFLKGAIESQIAQAHGDTVRAIFEGETARTVPVMGRIGAKAVVIPFDELVEPMYEVELPPTLDETQDFIAFEIEGISMPPAKPGWIVLFKKSFVPPEDLIGFPCMVDLANGQRLFKELRRGYAKGRYNLVSWDGTEPMEDQEVVAALPFAAMTPGRMQR